MRWRRVALFTGMALVLSAAGWLLGALIRDPVPVRSVVAPPVSKVRFVDDPRPHSGPVDATAFGRQRARLDALLPTVDRDLAVCAHFHGVPAAGLDVSFDVAITGEVTVSEVHGGPPYEAFASCAQTATAFWEPGGGPKLAVIEAPVTAKLPAALTCIADPELRPMVRRIGDGARLGGNRWGGEALLDRYRMLLAERQESYTACYHDLTPGQAPPAFEISVSEYGAFLGVEVLGTNPDLSLTPCLTKALRGSRYPAADSLMFVHVPITPCR